MARAFDDSEDDRPDAKIELLTEFSTATNVDKSKDVQHLVIERLPDSFRGSRNQYVPALLQDARPAMHESDIAQLEARERARNSHYGLNRSNPSHRAVTTTHGEPTLQVDVPPAADDLDRHTSFTAHEMAIDALVNPESEEDTRRIAAINRIELQSSMASAPDMSTLEEYETIPVEAFGLAMLRGMGYDPSKEKKAPSEGVKTRRPDFLGLGAKERPEESKTAEELARKKHVRRREERNYVPLIKVHKATGQIVQEGQDKGNARTKSNGHDDSRSSERKRDEQTARTGNSAYSGEMRRRGQTERYLPRESEDRHYNSSRSARHRHHSRSPRRDSSSSRSTRADGTKTSDRRIKHEREKYITRTERRHDRER